MWGPEQDTIFKSIKDNFLKTIMLQHPNFNRPFFMNCDASDISLGSVLYQEDDDGNHQVVSFASRILNHCERNYHVTEKELLSVVFSCGKFRTYILGYPITVRTDHKSISFLKNCKLSHGRLTRWILALQEYHISWEYIPGSKNIAADVLSHINLEQQTFDREKETIVKVFNIMKSKSDLETIIKEVKQHQKNYTKLNQIRERLSQQDERITPFYCVHEDTLFIQTSHNQNSWKLVCLLYTSSHATKTGNN